MTEKTIVSAQDKVSLLGYGVITIGLFLWVYLCLSDLSQIRVQNPLTIFLTHIIPPLIHLIVSLIVVRIRIINTLNLFLLGTFLILTAFNVLLTLTIGKVRGIGIIYPISYIFNIPITRTLPLLDFFIFDLTTATLYSQAIVFAIAVCIPLTFRLLHSGYYLSTRIWNFLRAEESEETKAVFKYAEDDQDMDFLTQIRIGVREFEIEEFVRFMLLNMFTYVSLLSVLVALGISVLENNIIAEIPVLVPSYIGYLAIAQGFISTIFVIKKRGFLRIYRGYVKVLLPTLSITTFVSLGRSHFLKKQVFDFLSIQAIVYLRNSLITPFFLVILLPVLLNLTYSIRRRFFPCFCVFLALMWPFILLAFRFAFPAGHISNAALFSLNVIYPTVSWWLTLYVVGIVLKELEMLPFSHGHIGKWSILLAIVFNLRYYLLFFGIWKEFIILVGPLLQLSGYGWLLAWCLIILGLTLISVLLRIGLSIFLSGTIILVLIGQIWISIFGFSTGLAIALWLKPVIQRLQISRYKRTILLYKRRILLRIKKKIKSIRKKGSGNSSGF